MIESNPMTESLKIIGLSILAGAIYGIIHDQVTARVCLEYFTVFHPDVFHTQSPTLLALGCGVLATWWISMFLGLMLAIAAQAGSRPTVSAGALLPRLIKLLAIMAICALVAGIVGNFLQGFGMGYYATNIPKQIRHRFYADYWAHSMSYLSGFVGGIILSILVWRSRGKMASQGTSSVRAATMS